MSRAAALLLFVAAATSASASLGPGLEPLDPVLGPVGAEGHLATLWGTVGGALAQTPQPPEPPAPPAGTDCGGTAPLTLSCEQNVAAPGGARWTLQANAGTGFSGTIVATLTDQAGTTATWTCTYLAYVGGVSEAPACHGSGADLAAGTLRLAGSVTDTASGAPSAGGWEVTVHLA